MYVFNIGARVRAVFVFEGSVPTLITGLITQM